MNKFKLNQTYTGFSYEHNTYKVIKITDCYITVLYNSTFKKRFRINTSNHGMHGQYFNHDKDIVLA